MKTRFFVLALLAMAPLRLRRRQKPITFRQARGGEETSHPDREAGTAEVSIDSVTRVISVTLSVQPPDRYDGAHSRRAPGVMAR
jgi:hypothetical protein